MALLCMSIILLLLPTYGGIAEKIVSIIDASGEYPQCSEGNETYMKNCVFPSDFFSYIPSLNPTFVNKTCASMGYEYIGPEKIFTGFSPYWKGGRPAFDKYNTAFHQGHELIENFLNFTRDHNQACAFPSSGPQIQQHSQKIAENPQKIAAQDQVQHYQSQQQNNKLQDQLAAYYDASGVYAQCGEGPYGYLKNCVMPSDYLMYMLSKQPTIVNKTCSDLGYQKVMPDPIFRFDLYWIGGVSNFQKFFEKWGPGHPDNGKFLNKTRDDNPACV